MITNANKKVVCIKDIPSNIIEEAIFILKSDVENSNKSLRKEIVLKETEDLVNEYSDIFEEDEKIENDKKNKIEELKLKVLLGTIGFVRLFTFNFYFFINHILPLTSI